MNKKNFYKDKHKKINQSINQLSTITIDKSGNIRLKDDEISFLRSESYNLIRQIHQLEAGRNIFVDNDKDQ